LKGHQLSDGLLQFLVLTYIIKKDRKDCGHLNTFSNNN